MDQAMVNRWADALESGKFEQASGSLRKKDRHGNVGYCCLGVLKEITGCTWKEAVSEDDGGKFDLLDIDSIDGGIIYFPEDYDREGVEILPDSRFTYPTDEDLEEWGLDWGEARDLAEKNDGGYSFGQIAGYIRSSLIREHSEAA